MRLDPLAEVDGVLDRNQFCERLPRRLRTVFFLLLALVDPLDGSLWRPRNQLVAELHQLAGLSVQERVADDQLLVVQVFLVARCFEAEVLEIKTQGAQAARLKPLFKLLQLLYECPADFEVGPPRIQKLERLQHRPAILLHEVGREDH